MQEALLSFHTPEEKAILARLSENVLIEAFEPVQESDLDQLKAVMNSEAASFDGAK